MSIPPIRASIVYMTGRKDPHLDWILDGLATQAKADDRIELIVIDGLPGRPSYERGGNPWFRCGDAASPGLIPAHLTPNGIIGDRELAICRRPELAWLNIRVAPPKPNIWQGPHRITPHDWWATSNARNTGITLASHPWIAFLDDRQRLGPHWLEEMRIAAARPPREQSVVVGTYDKLETHEEGAPHLKRTTDHRRALAPLGKINCGGQWLYGCTFGLPLEWALEVNGLEEGCDSLTGEDYIFGLMLGNTGKRIDFVTGLYVEQDRAEGTEHRFRSTDKGTAPNDKSHAALAWFGKARRTVFTPDLRALRETLAAGGEFPIPDPASEYRDWYDGQDLRTMIAP